MSSSSSVAALLTARRISECKISASKSVAGRVAVFRAARTGNRIWRRGKPTAQPRRRYGTSASRSGSRDKLALGPHLSAEPICRLCLRCAADDGRARQGTGGIRRSIWTHAGTRRRHLSATARITQLVDFHLHRRLVARRVAARVLHRLDATE